MREQTKTKVRESGGKVEKREARRKEKGGEGR